MNEAEKLLQKYQAGEATPEERALVETWYLQHTSPPSGLQPGDIRKSGRRGMAKLLSHMQGRRGNVWPAIFAAAAVLLVICGVLLMDVEQRQAPVAVAQATSLEDIQPGGDKAFLTLADGRKIVLDDADSGQLAKEGNMAISKSASGELVYNATGSAPIGGADAVLSYNTLATPRGGQYKIVLPDGSRVWLNAGSSLRFPVSFAATERRVELEGEGYFEIQRDAARPFVVHTDDARVKVLGTHFNISAYKEDKEWTTTLLEGAVEVSSKNGDRAMLRPGQQANLAEDRRINLQTVDAAISVAWKNGYFDFRRASVKDIMKQFSRWYDIDVVYDGAIADDEYVGKIRRGVTLKQALNMLEMSNINFRIEGKTIFIK